MRFAGVLPEDAPDPRIEASRRLLDLPFPLMGLSPQPTIEDTEAPAITQSADAQGQSHLAVGFSYRLWRNPQDRADPINLKDLDESERAALDTVPPWPRPAWLIEYVEMMRYPLLWEAVRTSWARTPSPYAAPSRQLVDHTNYILMNQFREVLGLPPGPTADGPWRVRETSVNPTATLEIDRKTVPAFEIDTDPFVYAIGARLRPDVVTTVVISREHLPYVHVALSTRSPAGA